MYHPKNPKGQRPGLVILSQLVQAPWRCCSRDSCFCCCCCRSAMGQSHPQGQRRDPKQEKQEKQEKQKRKHEEFSERGLCGRMPALLAAGPMLAWCADHNNPLFESNRNPKAETGSNDCLSAKHARIDSFIFCAFRFLIFFAHWSVWRFAGFDFCSPCLSPDSLALAILTIPRSFRVIVNACARRLGSRAGSEHAVCARGRSRGKGWGRHKIRLWAGS